MIAGQVLRKAGLEVQELCNELESMETIRRFQPDLILMDPPHLTEYAAQARVAADDAAYKRWRSAS